MSRMSDGLGQLPERYDFVTRRNDEGRPMSVPVWCGDDMRAYAAQEVAAALNARELMHAESSRIYARLASAVQSGAADATLGRLLRGEVMARLEGVKPNE